MANPAYPFKNLVFEGGGVKGIAYVGALQVLAQEDALDQITRVGGASAGAIMALLVGLNYSIAEIETILRGLDFNNFLDDDFGIIRDTERLIGEYGWYKGDFFRNWIGELIKRKTGSSEATFNDLKSAGTFRDLYFVGTNLSTEFGEVFSHEHTPRDCVADAVRITMSIPLFFAAVRSIRGDVYVNGGLLDNYPIKLFDREKYLADPSFGKRTAYYDQHNAQLAASGIGVSPYVYNKQTLGFRLDSAKEIAVFRDHAEPPRTVINDFFDYAKAIVGTLLESQQSQHLHGDDWQRTVYIDTLGVGTTDFDLDDERKNALVQSGQSGAQKYLGWFLDPAQHPANRV